MNREITDPENEFKRLNQKILDLENERDLLEDEIRRRIEIYNNYIREREMEREIHNMACELIKEKSKLKTIKIIFEFIKDVCATQYSHD